LKIFLLILVSCFFRYAAAQNEITPLPLNQLNKDSLNEVIQKKENAKDFKVLSGIYGGMFMYYCESHNRALAFEYAIKTEECALKAGDSAKYYFTETKLGEFSADGRDYKTAISYYQNALRFYQRTKNYKMLFHVYGGLSNTYKMQGNLTRSADYESLAIESNAKGKDTLGIVILNDIRIRNLIDSNKLSESILLAKNNLTLIDEAQTFGSGEATRQIRRKIELNYLGECYNKLKDYATAIKYLKQVVSANQEIDFNDLDISRYHLLIKSYISLGEKDSALKYSDSLSEKLYQAFENVNPEKLNEISAKYETEKKQRQIEQLQLQNHLQQLTVATQRKLNIAFISMLMLALVTTYFILKNVQQKRKMQLNLQQQEAELAKKAAIERERNRISSELHDDLGGGLSSINLISEMMKSKPDNEISKQLNKISDSSKELVQKMNEIVWALNINNDNLQSLLAYIRQYAVKTLDDVNIKCSVTTPENIPVVSIAGNERRNIFLMVKECINNIVKHSKATEVSIEVILAEKLCIKINDNGIGFSCNENGVHHFGLNNLKQRAKELNGSIEWLQNNGTHVQIQIPLKTLSHKSVSS
jgi:signal transduction histidine kinase